MMLAAFIKPEFGSRVTEVIAGENRGNDELRCSVDRVEALEQLFAGFEVRHGLARHRHLTAGTRVAVPVHGFETPICAYAAMGIRPS